LSSGRKILPFPGEAPGRLLGQVSRHSEKKNAEGRPGGAPGSAERSHFLLIRRKTRAGAAQIDAPREREENLREKGLTTIPAAEKK